MPALKRIMCRVELPGALKRSYPRINAGASTQRLRTGFLPQPVEPPYFFRQNLSELLSYQH